MGKTQTEGRDRIVSSPVAIDLLHQPRNTDNGQAGRKAFKKYASGARIALIKSARRRAAKKH